MNDAETMNEPVNDVNQMQEEKVQPLGDIFKHDKDTETEESVNDPEPIAEEGREKTKASSSEELEEEPDDEMDLDAEYAVLQGRHEKVQKNLQDTQRWGHDLSRRLKASQEKIQAYVDEGVLPPEKAQEFFESVVHQEMQEEQSPQQAILGMLSNELNNMQRYSNDPDLSVKIDAFEDLIARAPNAQDKEALLMAVAKTSDDPAMVAREAVKLGEWWLNEYYGEERAAGGPRALKTEYQTRLKIQQEKLDKLEKEVLHLRKNSDYISDKRYSLPSGSGSEATNEKDASIGGIFARAKAGKL